MTKLATVSVATTLILGTATIVSAGGSATKEMLLARSGFVLKNVTTERQREQVESLPEGQVSAIMYQHKLCYVYRTTQKDQVYVGRQRQFDAYKEALNSAENTSRIAREMQGQPEMVGETAGPNHIKIQEFDGFGPMDPFGDE